MKDFTCDHCNIKAIEFLELTSVSWIQRKRYYKLCRTCFNRVTPFYPNEYARMKLEQYKLAVNLELINNVLIS